ncbi:unnamed protein product [Rotaria sp. Silwood1]|nr:unnamed protein product [Rotaria sp. Silwood1]
MSSSALSSKTNTFVQSQAQYFNRQNSTLNSPMNVNRQSPSPSSTSTRIIGPKPFYRSQITPDPFDYTNNCRQQNDYQQSRQSPLQHRFSFNQTNVNDNDNDGDEFISSDESLSIEFPPPPSTFSTSPIINNTYQFIRVKNPFVQTNIGRSDSGSSLSNSYISDHEPSSPTITKTSQYRSTTPTNNNYNNNRHKFFFCKAVISVSSSQSPVITTAPREIRISRPDSPSISINNRQEIKNQSINYANGNDNAFHISLGTPPTTTNQREVSVSSPLSSIRMLGRSLQSIRQMDMHRDSPIDNQYTSNVVANRFKPLMAYTSVNSNKSPVFDNSERRSPSVVNLLPTSSHPNSTPFTMRNGNLIKRDASDDDHLTKLLMKSMCARWNDGMVGEENGLVAMDRMYYVLHVLCVVVVYVILRATGKPYHAECFCCIVCHKSLDGVPFTIDAIMKVRCIDCFHQKFAPRCYVCHRPILPMNSQEETIHIVALDRSYHVDCYRCENCKVQFTNEEGCYLIDDHILCIHCNSIYSRTMFGHT